MKKYIFRVQNNQEVNLEVLADTEDEAFNKINDMDICDETVAGDDYVLDEAELIYEEDIIE